MTATVTVNGVEHKVTYRGNTVEGALAAAGVDLSAGDLVEPALGQRVPNGAKVRIVHARDVTIDKDGQVQVASVPAMTVSEALSMLKIDTVDANVSPGLDTKLDREGGKITVRSPKAGTVMVNGRETPISVVAKTVGDALAAAGIPVGASDKVSPKPSSPYSAGTQIVIKRTTTETVETTSYVNYRTKTRKDKSLARGVRKTIQRGIRGKKVTVHKITYRDGEEVSKEVVSSSWVRKPQSRIIAVGTKTKPKAAPEPKPSPSTKPKPSPTTKPKPADKPKPGISPKPGDKPKPKPSA